MPLPKSVVYKDFDIIFDRHPVTRKLNTLTNNDAVKRSLKNIILTNKFERAYSPNFGSDIKSRLFEQFDTNIADDIANDIEFAVANFEPRVQLIDVLVREVPDQHGITITIKFRARNQVDVDQLELFIERVR
tara:strand:- start:538 stop:933 length:396 start_codon:yes stop_codon:yes gene_type:complete